ncbi:CDP-alcohol phosphatidyltransferase family protein [Pedobacter sp. LMG 31464]|uniref:CDP-alcohol phosphatidyltransferase family protein n=1 Tax=Pedobacter planticolens TaxID=2679964 RepID=A0A923DXL5_9SPHI|nr:CDP-alcohol phosphatidyltransferase family protein [Pedobacter planticolens]MBB2144333.1 CDP-alcohol phosphatidyltransferase family protein [Pedobacter planticolens]
MSIPYLLILFRFLLAPIIIFLSYVWREEVTYIVLILMFLGLLSDIFDGIIARKMKIDTEKMRRLDSQTDLIFWLSISVSCYLIYPELIKENLIGVLAIVLMEAVCYGVSLIKFGKETCTHAFVSKMWGLTLLATFTCLLGFAYGGWMMKICIILGLISQIDVILIILFLPKWTHDIPSFYHAILIRKGIEFKKSKYLNS